MAVIKQEVTGSEEKSEDFVNDQIPLDKKTNMECLRYEKEVAEYQERKGATVLTVPNLSDFRNSEIECFEDGSSYSPPPKLVSSKRSNQKNPKNDAAEGTGQNIKASENENSEKLEILRSKLASFYSNVMVVDNVSAAKKVVWMLTNKYKHLVHACDTEVLCSFLLLVEIGTFIFFFGRQVMSDVLSCLLFYFFLACLPV